MGKVRLAANQDLKEVAEWLALNVGSEFCNRNLPIGHRKGQGWYFAIRYVNSTEWYTADVEIDEEEKMLLFILSHKCII